MIFLKILENSTLKTLSLVAVMKEIPLWKRSFKTQTGLNLQNTNFLPPRYKAHFFDMITRYGIYMSGTDFLTFLVDETLKLQMKGEAKLSSLELKLTDYKLDFIRGEFIPQSQMLRFTSSFGVFDIPVNWSVFSSEKYSQYCILNEKEDQDCLFKVLRTAWNPNFTKILITHSNGFCYLVGLKSGDECHLHDLINHQEFFKAS